MTIFARRSIQRMLDELADILSGEQLSSLVTRLNQNDPQSLPREWEVLVLFGLNHLGRVAHECSFSGSRKPDVFFQLAEDHTVQFAADVTCVSDRGLEDANPIDQLVELIRQKAQKLGITAGAFEYRVRHENVGSHRKRKLRLKLPPKAKLHEFFQSRIVPWLKGVARAPQHASSLGVTDASHDIDISYQPGRRYTTANYPAFNLATAITSNPVYNALEDKRDQLVRSGYDGPKGIIACDGGCDILTRNVTSWQSFSKAQIIGEFFRQHSAISFVLLLWIDEPFRPLGPQPSRTMRRQLFVNPKAAISLSPSLQEVLLRMPEWWPLPIQNAKNARLELEGTGRKKAERHWGHSFWGGGQMSDHRFRMSARGLVELLAGQRTKPEFDEAHRLGRAVGRDAPPNFFEQAIHRGLTISGVSLERRPNEDDDWIEFQFSEPDPAIAPFRANMPGSDRSKK